LGRPDKELVKKRFARSLKTYAEHAHVQRATAERMLFELRASAGEKFDRIFEIGCGAGVLTQMIRKQLFYKELYLNDLVDECEKLIQDPENEHFSGGDIEHLEVLPSSLDLVLSNATFQWLDHLGEVLERLFKALHQDGTLAFSTFGPENAREIAQAKGTSLKYLTVPELKAVVSEHFSIQCFHENIRQLHFKHPMDVLRHLKNTGVTAVSKEIWTRSGLKNFITDYIECCGNDEGVTLTYHPIVVIARKK
jgi:malonyl-ACP O-methyltransferase BioC